ncbi:HAD-IA family hydrolase [Pseudomonas aeruginosa]|nr:HAD-IA family hydrolase [Pseudomonas aeruginosa]
MDPLDRLIQLANLQGRLDQRCQLQGSWALEHPQAVPGEATFHIVMAGTCYCEFLDGGRLDLHPGDLILLPRGTPHLLRSDSAAQPCEPTVERRGSIPLYQLNGPGEALDMLCGSYRYHAGASLFGALPERLLVHMDESTQQPLRALIGLMREEAESTRSGARSIIDALATALLALDLPVAVASNSRRHSLERSLARAGLSELIGERLASADMVALPKPAPDVYLHAASLLGVAPERCLVVEDSSTGTRAALAAGMRVIGFVGAGHIPAGHAEVLRELGAIAIVEHMRELPETVARLRRTV